MRLWRARPGYDWKTYRAPREKELLYQANYRQKHREEIRQKRKQSYAINLEENRRYQREWKKAWRMREPEKSKIAERKRSPLAIIRRRKRIREYSKSHRAIRLANEGIRRARKKCGAVGDTKEIRKIYERAQTLRAHGIKVHVDHIIPLSKQGSHSSDNLQIIPEFENNRKHTNSNYKPIFIFT